MVKVPYFLYLIIKIAYLFIHGSRNEVEGMFHTSIGLLILLQPLLMSSPFPH